MDDTNVAQGAGDRQKKQYQPPELVCYGDVALVTRGGGGTSVDGNAKHSHK